jgi:hypothetical protein
MGECERIIHDVGVAVPGLGVGGVDGGEAGGVGGRPAALDAVFAEWEVVHAVAEGAVVLPGEGNVGWFLYSNQSCCAAPFRG